MLDMVDLILWATGQDSNSFLTALCGLFFLVSNSSNVLKVE
jgi:hypothetical protein